MERDGGSGAGIHYSPNIRGAYACCPNPVVVTVVVTDAAGCQTQGTWMDTPITAEVAAAVKHLCELRNFLQVNWFVDPLWDPLRDLVTTPITEQDITRIRQAAAQVAQLAERLVPYEVGG